ncbi:MAG: sodium:solute symporter family protein [Halanaerobiaceae bacterium]
MVLITIIVYMVILLAIGYWASRKIEVMEDFLLAGRRLGLLLTAGALAATHFGGGMVMGGGEYGFIHGISGAWYGISCGIGLILLGFLTASRFRSLAFYTVPDYLEHRYGGKSMRVLGALLSLMAIIGIIAAQVIAAQDALAILGFEGNTAAVIATVIFIVYTALGGLWAASVTDFIQVIIAGVGVILASALVLNDVGGFSGLAGFIESSRESVDAGYFNFFGMGGKTIIWMLLPTVMYTLIGQDFYQRLFAAKDKITARRASFVGGVFLILISIFPTIAGMSARGYFPGLEDGGRAIPRIIEEVFPLGVGAVVLAALLAAIMSTADSLLTAGTSHIINDLWLKLKGGDDDINKLAISRLFTVLLGAVALIIALLVPTIIDALIYSYTMYTAGVFVPVIGGVIWKGATKEGAMTALLGGSLVAIMGILLNFEFGKMPVEVYSGLISLVLFVIVSLATGRKKADIS